MKRMQITMVKGLEAKSYGGRLKELGIKKRKLKGRHNSSPLKT